MKNVSKTDETQMKTQRDFGDPMNWAEGRLYVAWQGLGKHTG